MEGNFEPAKGLFSQRDDVTLGNPFGPFARGFDDVVDAMTRAAANYGDGEAEGFDRITTYADDGLVCIVEVERLRSKVGGRNDVTSLALRVTTVFRSEDEGWRVVHRHADPITEARPAESVLPT
jgi:ketosteroid isomerase-like protein